MSIINDTHSKSTWLLSRIEALRHKGTKKDYGSLFCSGDKKHEKKSTALAISIFIICLGFLLPALSAQDTTRIIAVSAKEASDLIDKHNGDNDFAILDIRTPGEFQSGHLPKSILIDFYSKSFVDQLSRLDKEKTFLIYCRTGNRSTQSLEIFKKLKFQKVYHMASGISAWKSEGFSVVK